MSDRFGYFGKWLRRGRGGGRSEGADIGECTGRWGDRVYTVPTQQRLDLDQRFYHQSWVRFEHTSTAKRRPSPSPTIAHPCLPSRGIVNPCSKRSNALAREAFEGDPKRCTAVFAGRWTNGSAFDIPHVPYRVSKSRRAETRRQRVNDTRGSNVRDGDSEKVGPNSPTRCRISKSPLTETCC